MRSHKNIDPVLILLIVTSVLLLFVNLGNMYLWVDEAETAVLAKNTVTFGYPRASDGKNTLEIFGPWENFGKYDKNYIWTIHPWLQFYVAAASFMLFGPTTFAARFPFAIFGLGSVLLTYLLTQKLFQNKNISRISTALLTLSVPYLIHMRQCRYYALLPFFSLWLILAYLRFVEQKKFSVPEIIISSMLLFHSNYGAFLSVAGAIFIHYLIFNFKKQDIGKLAFMVITVTLLTIPWFFYFKPFSHVTELSFYNLRRQIEFLFRSINKYVFPIAFFFLVSVFKYFRNREKPFKNISGKRSGLWLISMIVMVSIFMLIFVEQRIFRYMIHFIPLLYILQGVILEQWFKSSKKITTFIFIILISTNLFNNPKIKSPLFDYAWEITHDYDGPNEGIVKFLNKNAKKGDQVKVSYSATPIIFYTKGLVVDYKGDFEKNETFPEWIIPRQHWVSQNFWKSQYFQKINSSYQKIELAYPDLQWGNRPEPGYHKYKTVTNSPKITIFKRLSK